MKKMKRNIKVNATSGYKYKPVPTIILKGNYLEQYGFTIDTKVVVELSDGKIVIHTKNQ